MDKNKLSLDIEKFEIVSAEEYSNEQLAIVEVYVCHDGNNRHNVPISNKALRAAKDTLKNKFLVAGFDGNDFEGHEPDERIIGFFPESSKMRFVKKDGRTYLVAQAIMSKIYAKWAYDIFTNSGNERAVSMEITVLRGKVDDYDNLETIEEFVFNGVTVLGLTHVPACEGSSASIIKFDVENALRVYNKHYKGATDLKKSYVDNMVKFSGKEEVEIMNETEVKTEEVVEEETTNTDDVVECETPEEKDDETMYSESEKEEDSEDKKEESEEESKEEVVEEESLPTENCETEEESTEPEGEEEDYETVKAERDSLKEENAALKATVEKYEAADKAAQIEAIISSVTELFSADEISELREEAQKYSLNEINVFDNEVKAKAYDKVKESTVTQSKSFTKVAINDVLDKPKSKFTW